MKITDDGAKTRGQKEQLGQLVSSSDDKGVEPQQEEEKEGDSNAPTTTNNGADDVNASTDSNNGADSHVTPPKVIRDGTMEVTAKVLLLGSIFPY